MVPAMPVCTCTCVNVWVRVHVVSPRWCLFVAECLFPCFPDCASVRFQWDEPLKVESLAQLLGRGPLVGGRGSWWWPEAVVAVLVLVEGWPRPSSVQSLPDSSQSPQGEPSPQGCGVGSGGGSPVGHAGWGCAGDIPGPGGFCPEAALPGVRGCWRQDASGSEG